MADSNPQRILVLGATGGVGRFVCEAVLRLFGPASLVVGDYIPDRGQEYAKALGGEVSSARVDVSDKASVEKAVAGGLDAIIVTVQQADPIVQSVCLSRGIPCLDVTVDVDFLEKARRLDSRTEAGGAASIIMAGLIPGLSGVMARHLVDSLDEVSSIDVGLLQSAKGSAGVTGIADMLGVFAQPVQFRSKGEQHWRPGFTVKREMRFPEPFGNKAQRLINWVEVPVVVEKCGVHDVNYWTGFDDASFESLLAFLKKTGFLSLFNRKSTRKAVARMIAITKGGKRPDTETIALTLEVSGLKDGAACTRCVSLVGPSDYGTTGMSVVAMAKLILEGSVKTAGIRVPLEVFPLDVLIEAMDCEEVNLHRLS